MGNIEITTKFSKLESISTIEDNYLEAATGGFFIKKAALKNFAIFTGKQLCWSLFLIKLQAFRLATLLKRDSNTGVFLCILRSFIYLEKYLQTAASDYCFKRHVKIVEKYMVKFNYQF